MGFLQWLFGKNESKHQKSAPTESSIPEVYNMLPIHPDLEGLIWVADGPKRNYVSKPHRESYSYGGITISISGLDREEPSVISTKLPIAHVTYLQEIERPPYYPSYTSLTPEQRGVYWHLLANPYNSQIDIGFVFVLYYGLERHLLEGDFDRAFHVILKLRDAHSNKSFQSYSANAVVLMCLMKQRADLAIQFIGSLDKDHEINFSGNLLLLCKLGLGIPLTAQELMRQARTFGFDNQNYIKKNPDIFVEQLEKAIEAETGAKKLHLDQYVTSTDLSKVKMTDIHIFANMSIIEKTLSIPNLAEHPKLMGIIYKLLHQAHNSTKQLLAEMRKKGDVIETKNDTSKVQKALVFDAQREAELLDEYRKCSRNPVNRHFALISLCDFYYKYRNLDPIYLKKCIEFCKKDISTLDSLQAKYIEQETKQLQKTAIFRSADEQATKLASVEGFQGEIPAFKRLTIIYEKSKDYSKAIDICNRAIQYYQSIGKTQSADEFKARQMKLNAKMNQ